MMTSFLIEEGKCGRRLVVTSSWSDEMKQYILSNPIEELYLNYARGWKGKDLSFLTTFPGLKAFSIIDWNIDDISSIHALHHLRRLEISTYCKTEIDFSQFPALEECSLEWRPKAKSIFSCHTLKHLFLNRYSGVDTSKFSELAELESLSLANAPIRNLYGLESLKKLKFLGLYNLRKLEFLCGIEGLIHLETLEVNGCRSITSIKAVENLFNLRKFHFCDDGDIESLQPLASLTQLKEVLFYESTNIVDGDLSPLKKLKCLSNISFQDRRHYSHRRRET